MKNVEIGLSLYVPDEADAAGRSGFSLESSALMILEE